GRWRATRAAGLSPDARRPCRSAVPRRRRRSTATRATPRLHGSPVPAGGRSMPPGYRRSTETVLVPARSTARLVVMSEKTIALVTGANKGIGYEIAAGLGALGWSVGVGARDEQRREAAVEKLRAAGVDAFGVPLDVTDDASVAAAAGLIEERAGRLDVLVN